MMKILLLSLSIASIFFCWINISTNFSGLIISFNDKSIMEDNFPVSHSMPPDNFVIEFKYYYSWLSPDVFYFWPDDCLNRVVINGETMSSAYLPFCDYTYPVKLDLGKYLKEGNNSIILIMANKGWAGGADVFIAWNNIIVLLLIAYSIITCAYFFEVMDWELILSSLKRLINK